VLHRFTTNTTPLTNNYFGSAYIRGNIEKIKERKEEDMLQEVKNKENGGTKDHESADAASKTKHNEEGAVSRGCCILM